MTDAATHGLVAEPLDHEGSTLHKHRAVFQHVHLADELWIAEHEHGVVRNKRSLDSDDRYYSSNDYGIQLT